MKNNIWKPMKRFSIKRFSHVSFLEKNNSGNFPELLFSIQLFENLSQFTLKLLLSSSPYQVRKWFYSLLAGFYIMVLERTTVKWNLFAFLEIYHVYITNVYENNATRITFCGWEEIATLTLIQFPYSDYH